MPVTSNHCTYHLKHAHRGWRKPFPAWDNHHQHLYCCYTAARGRFAMKMHPKNHTSSGVAILSCKMSLHNTRTDSILMHTARWHHYTRLEMVCTITLITTEWTIPVCSAVSNRLSPKFTACGWNAPLTTVLPDLTQRVLLWICLAITPQVKYYVVMPLLRQWLTKLSCSWDTPLWLCFNWKVKKPNQSWYAYSTQLCYLTLNFCIKPVQTLVFSNVYF